uniref:Peptidyl-prolyl cis-trans isomerase n=1 Tax=Neogobius melanostomus TaxID=47308 RepID=A0A8C6UJS4_9GOBI
MAMSSEIEIVGLLKEAEFHASKSLAEGLKEQFQEAFHEPQIKPLLENEWETYLWTTKRELRGEVWQYSSSLMCFLNGQLLGNETDLSKWATDKWNFTITQPPATYEALAYEYYHRYLQKTGNHFVFMDIEIAQETIGRLLFELFTDVCPKTSRNFKALCTGEQGMSASGFPLCYKGSVLHRVVPNGWVQGGDISPTQRDDGGESIYGQVFEDESFAITHSKRGILGMANKGPHSNGSQFYITLQPTPWMDGTYVAFGQLIEGVDVLKTIEEAPTSNERPKYDCKIINCGILNI